MRICKNCGNLKEKLGNNRFYTCRLCRNVRVRKWKETPNGISSIRRRLFWARENYIGKRLSDGSVRQIRVIGKRKRTEQCEMCRKSGENKRLVYHHWDDEDYSKGLWICQRCHNIAEGVEAGYAMNYEILKRKINETPKWERKGPITKEA